MTDIQDITPLTPRQMAGLAFGMMSMGVSMTINFVVVAPLAREAGLTEIQVALILTLSAAIYAFLTPWWGRLSDRIGRKPVIVFSLIAAATTNAAFILALGAALQGALVGVSMLATLAAVRAFFGLLSPGIHPASMGLVAETTTPKDRAAGLGLLGAAMGFGSLVGPAGAIPLAKLGALAPLWGAVGLSLLGALVVFALVPNVPPLSADARPKPLAMTDRRVRPFLVFLFAYFVAVGAVQQTLAFLIQDRYNLDQAAAVQGAGVAFAAFAVTSLFVQFAVVQRYKPDPRWMLRIGLCIVVLGYAITALPLSFAVLCSGFGLVGSGAALAIPGTNALASLNVTPREQGSAAALMAMAPPSGFVVGPLLGAALYQVSPSLPLIMCAGSIAVLAVFAMTRLTAQAAESSP